MRTVTPLDFDVFAAAGRAVVHGQDPYPAVDSPYVWSGSAFVYPWFSAWVFALLSPFSLHVGAIVMAVASFGVIAAGVFCLVGTRMGAFVCVLLSAPTLDGLQIGTINAFLFLGVCLAWRWRDTAVSGGLAVGVLVALKLFCWPLAVWLLCTRRWRGAAWAIGSAAVLTGVSWLLGPIGAVPYARLLGELSSHEVHQAVGVQGELVRSGMTAGAAELVGLAAGLALVVLSARRGTLLGYGGAVVGCLIASPVVWHHYYLLCAAPVLLVPSGATLYLLFGWLSISARTSYGISWLPVTAAVAGVLLVLAATTAWRRRTQLVRWWRAIPAGRLAAVLIGLSGLIALLAAASLHHRLSAIGSAAVPLIASLALLVVLRRPAETGADPMRVEPGDARRLRS